MGSVQPSGPWRLGPGPLLKSEPKPAHFGDFPQFPNDLQYPWYPLYPHDGWGGLVGYDSGAGVGEGFLHCMHAATEEVHSARRRRYLLRLV